MDERCRNLRRALAADPNDRASARALLAYYARAGASPFRITGPRGAELSPELFRDSGLDGPLRFVHPGEGGGPCWWIFFEGFGGFLAWVRERQAEGEAAVDSRFTVDWPRRLVVYQAPD